MMLKIQKSFLIRTGFGTRHFLKPCKLTFYILLLHCNEKEKLLLCKDVIYFPLEKFPLMTSKAYTINFDNPLKYDIFYHPDSNMFECNGKSYTSEYPVYIVAYLRKANKGFIHYVKDSVILGTLEAKKMAKLILNKSEFAYKDLKNYN